MQHMTLTHPLIFVTSAYVRQACKSVEWFKQGAQVWQTTNTLMTDHATKKWAAIDKTACSRTISPENQGTGPKPTASQCFQTGNLRVPLAPRTNAVTLTGIKAGSEST